MTISVAAFSGGLRTQSYNTKLVRAFQKLAPDDVTVKIIGIGGLPLGVLTWDMTQLNRARAQSRRSSS